MLAHMAWFGHNYTVEVDVRDIVCRRESVLAALTLLGLPQDLAKMLKDELSVWRQEADFYTRRATLTLKVRGQQLHAASLGPSHA